MRDTARIRQAHNRICRLTGQPPSVGAAEGIVTGLHRVPGPGSGRDLAEVFGHVRSLHQLGGLGAVEPGRVYSALAKGVGVDEPAQKSDIDRKSTRLQYSHGSSSY